MSFTEQLAAGVPVFHKKDFSSLTPLAEGGEAITYKGTHSYFGDICAKIFRYGPALGSIHNEIRLLLKHGNHPNVVQLFGLFEDNSDPLSRPAQIGYVMEFLPGGNLSSVIYSNWQYNERHVLFWVMQAGRGLQYLHQFGIIHRDVKPANMLLNDSKKFLKIGDFGISRRLDVHTSTNSGTHIYMAPEMFCTQHKYGLSVDVYALAISFWEMLYRRHPFDGNNWPDKSRRPPLDNSFPYAIQALIKECWGISYERPSVMQIITTVDQYMKVTKQEPRIATLPPEEGYYQQIQTVSTQRSSRSSSQGNPPQSPATAPVQGNLSPARTQQPATDPVVDERPRHKAHKHHKKKRQPKVVVSDEEEDEVGSLSQSLGRNLHLNSVKNVDSSYAELLKSTLYAQFLRLPPQQFQLAVNSLTMFVTTAGTDIENLQQGIQTQCIRIFCIGPNGDLQQSVALFQLLGFQVENNLFASYTECYRFITFLHFNVNKINCPMGRNEFSEICTILQDLQRIYVQEERIPRVLQNIKFNVLLVSNSKQLNANQFIRELQNYCQSQTVLDDLNLNPMVTYRLEFVTLLSLKSSPCLAVQASSVGTAVLHSETIHQIIYLIDSDASYGTFGSDWKTLTSSIYSRLMIGCNSRTDYQGCSQELKQAFMDKDDFYNVIPFLKRQNGQQADTCFAGICEMYKMMHSVYRQCVMNVVNKIPALGR